MTKPITMENNSSARERRRSRKRYESSDHNFDTLVLTKYETRKTALDPGNSGGTRVLKDSAVDSGVGVSARTRKYRSKSVKADIGQGESGTPARKTRENSRLDASDVPREKVSGLRRSSWAGSRVSKATESKDLVYDEEDHNFDRLSQSLGSGNNMMQSKYLGGLKMFQNCETESGYWKEYREKYGKLGIKSNDKDSDHKASLSYRVSTSLENVTSNSKPNSPRDNMSVTSLAYSNTGVIGRHSFDRKDSDDENPDLEPESSQLKSRSASRDRTKNKNSRFYPDQETINFNSKNAWMEKGKNKNSESAMENKDGEAGLCSVATGVSEKPPRGGSGRRRATSDLGFTEDTGGSTPRTSALLRQPSFRKHLAKMMHIKVKDTEQKGNEPDSLTLELAFKLASSTNLMKLKNCSEDDEFVKDFGNLKRSNTLRVSNSDHNLRSKSAENSPRASDIFDWEISSKRETFDLNDPEEEPVLMSSLTIPNSEHLTLSDLETKYEGHEGQHSKLSKFHIPSFNEFRKHKSKNGLLPDKMYPKKREKVIREESELDFLQKSDLERSMSLCRQVKEKQDRMKQLKRTNTDPSMDVPDLDDDQGQVHTGCHDKTDASELQDHKSVTEITPASSPKDKRGRHRKEHSRRKHSADLCGNLEDEGHSKVHSRSRTVPLDSSSKNEFYNQNDSVHAHKQTKPKHRSRSSKDSSVQSALMKVSDSIENEQKTAQKNSITDSEKDNDSDHVGFDDSERTKSKRRSLRKSRKKTESENDDTDNSVYVIEGVTILVSDSENNKARKDHNSTDSNESNTQPGGKDPVGLPPVAPKKLRRKSDRRSQRHRQKSIPEDEEVGSSDYLSSSGNFTSSTGDVQFDTDNDGHDFYETGKLSSKDQNSVIRSTSDVSEMLQEAVRKRETKERRTKPYKSDPFGSSAKRRYRSEGTLIKDPTFENELSDQKYEGKRRERRGSSKEEIISFLHDAKKSSLSRSKDGSSAQSLDSNFEEYVTDEDDKHRTEVERVDSGVGSDIKEDVKSNIEVKEKSRSTCDDCSQIKSNTTHIGGDGEQLCDKCTSLRVERKEAIQEIVDTEISYGKDLKIIKEEFYLPMKTAGLLNADQISIIFGNLLELITVNERFADQLQDTLDVAIENGDEDFMTVKLGKLFLEASNMLLAFEQYCVKQTAASNLVEQLEREKELLRIFLQVSQKDNSALRRMNLKSFLMVPVQRIMRYPLLINRTYKATSANHIDKRSLKDAQRKVEDIIEHINSSAKEYSIGTKFRRKLSGSKKYVSNGESDVELTKMALELLEWSKNDTSTVHIGKLNYTQPIDYLWTKKGKPMKFTPVTGILMTLGKSSCEEWTDRHMFPKNTGVKEAVLVLVKEKNGKFAALRDPIMLEKSVVSLDVEEDEAFDVMDEKKDLHIFKGDTKKETDIWYQHLKLQTKNLGQWRRRRNALPNIMIQNMGAKSKTDL